MTKQFIGLMSGTSMDAIDAVLVDFSDAVPRLQQAHRHALPDALRTELLACTESPEKFGIPKLGNLDIRLGQLFGEAALTLLDKARQDANEITGIGSHGQTVFHQPASATPFTLQLGDPNTIAEMTGITTVGHFRGRDMAAGGQGAPLVPGFHARLFQHATENRIVLNLGGIANITILPNSSSAPIRGFDTGPGNVLLDHWCQYCCKTTYDHQGAWGGTGKNNALLLQAMLKEPYFQQAPPKSTGRELFNRAWLEQHLETLAGAAIADSDVQSSLAELTARSVADAIREHAQGTHRVLVCGGGVHNFDLISRLQEQLGSCPVESTAKHGLDPDWVEAVAFAWLAQQTLEGKPGNVPTVTGAKHPVVLGAVYHK